MWKGCARKRAAEPLRHFWLGILATMLLGGRASALDLHAPAFEIPYGTIAPQSEGWSFTAVAERPWLAAPILEEAKRGLVAPGFSFGVARPNVLAAGDALSFTISRPERSVPFSAIWILGIDPERGKDLHLTQSDRLVPSAREFALRGAYRMRFGEWVGGVSLGYSFNAEQIAGRDAIRTLLSFTRSF